jgi:hypothetical protein
MQENNINIGRKKIRNKFTATFVATILLLTTFTVLFAVAAQTQENAQIWTTDEFGNPKNDFAPGEIVYIHGSDFSPDETVNINITRPDGVVETAPGGRFPGYLPTVQPDGTFSYEYDLDGIYGLYFINATDGFVSAKTTFTDGVSVDFSQYANLAPTYEKWIGSILQASNSVYYEGMSVPQRTAFINIAATTDNIHTLTIKHQSTKSGIHAYDWLTSWNQGNTPPLNYIPWGEDIGPKVTPEICGDLHNQTGANEYFLDVPDDPFVSKDGSTQDRIDAYEAMWGNRQIRICGNQAITSASWVSMVHDVANGGDTGDSYIEYELTWTSASTQILIEMAGHLSVSGDPVNNPIAWGIGLGAAQISGGPYHFKLDELDDHALGSQDNQIKGADIQSFPGNIIVNKITVPSGYAEDFEFDPSWDDLNFILYDGESNNSGNLEEGSYSVTEIAETGWTTTIDIFDPSGDSSSSGLTANIDLTGGETVIVNFTNSINLGTIIVEKQTIPDGATDTFTFTGDASGTITDGQQIVVSGLTPGQYTTRRMDTNRTHSR